MAITPQQRIERRKFLGSSDAAAVLGADKYRNAYDVHLDKTGQLAEDQGSETTDRGDFLEPALVLFAEHELGTKLKRNVRVVSPDRILAANLDAFIEVPNDKFNSPLGIPIEAKSTVLHEEWGEESDAVPERVAIQALHQMHCVGPECRVVLVPVVLPGFRTFDFRLYQVNRDDEVIREMVARLHEFWQRHVVERKPPQDMTPNIEILKRVKRQPGSIIELTEKQVPVIEAYEYVCEIEKGMKENVEEAKRNMLALLGDNEGATFPGGRLTYMLEGKDHEVTYMYKARRVPRIKRDKK